MHQLKMADTAYKRIGTVRLMLDSLVCSFGGWCVLIVYAHLHFYCLHQWVAEKTRANFARMGMEGWQPQRPSWLVMPSATTTTSLPYVAVVWLLFVLPLFIYVKPSCWLWKWPVTVVGFGTAGGLAMLGAIQYQVVPISDAIVEFAALTGAATGLFCSIAKQRHCREELTEQTATRQPPFGGVPR